MLLVVFGVSVGIGVGVGAGIDVGLVLTLVLVIVLVLMLMLLLALVLVLVLVLVLMLVAVLLLLPLLESRVVALVLMLPHISKNGGQRFVQLVGYRVLLISCEVCFRAVSLYCTAPRHVYTYTLDNAPVRISYVVA